MDHAFKELIGKIMANYQDDSTVHSKLKQLHPKNLREVFFRCRLLGIILNPRKCMFVVS